ncbi:unnamed protein product [Auanema sp. JU1783]|nr:unnamed protein product [Auanema sp. JU1783]
MKIIFLCLLVLYVHAAIDESRIKVFKWRGPSLLDETIFTNPKSFDYDFDEDIMKSADTNDIYDQVVRQLPAFQVFRKGHDEGYTKVPIVTRRGNTWSTLADTRGPKDFFATSPMPVEPKFVSTTVLPTTSHLNTEMPNNMSHMRIPNRQQNSQPFAKQPAPAFKAPDPSNHGPIWRKGGQIIFQHNNSEVSSRRVSSPSHTRITQNAEITRRPILSQTRRSWNINPPRMNTASFHRNTAVVQESQPKPVIIQRGNEPHRGPTYNCRVLNPYVDGLPSSDHNTNCKMLYPGLSLDGSCECIYTVSGRDQFGCAVGYNYSCKPK